MLLVDINTTAYLKMMAEYQCFNAFDHVKNGINSSNLHVLFHSKCHLLLHCSDAVIAD